ncbi:putative metal-nicotianamine transporter YSL6 [Hibiscus syriacus]|uniref:Metal-nicotianamine transporter YSL6 n=1 Tax=Hibiscus syriacus TaxID=106335 RepID=A0A6A2WMT0_HIBSY|nr:putative metal-nicotianamine transporter YSL6 [Hibiscus syriacus]
MERSDNDQRARGERLVRDSLLRHHHTQDKSNGRDVSYAERRRWIVRILLRGFGSYLIAMDERTYNLIGVDYPGNRAEDIKNPGIGWMIAFLSVASFVGLFSVAPLRKVFLSMALILGDGLYNMIKIMCLIAKEMCNKRTKESKLPIVQEVINDQSSEGLKERRKRDKVFLKDKIPTWFAASGYVALAAISTATTTIIFPPLKWYMVLVSYIIASTLAFCNSYGTGLADLNLSSTYGKIGLFIIASLVGSDGGMVVMSIVSTASDLMQDFKTGYLTRSSAKSMFVSQLVGTAMGCVIAPLTFWLLWAAFEVGSPDGPYKAPDAVIYRELAILGIEGFSGLPKHCLALCYGFFVAALVVNLLKDATPTKISQFIPLPMAMALGFYLGAYIAIDMFVGTVILFVWERINRKDAENYGGAVASGLIFGDGIWTIASAFLSIFKINPRICMYFQPSVSS